MSVHILDLAHNTKGFEDGMIADLKKFVEDVNELPCTNSRLELTLDSRADQIPPETRVVVVVCHGERTKDQVLTHGATTFHVGEFYLDTPVVGAEERLSGLPEPLIECMLAALRDPGNLPSWVVMPKKPYALVWFVCHSDTPDAMLFHDKQCVAALAFLGEADKDQWPYVADAIAALHGTVESGKPIDAEEYERIRAIWSGSLNSSFMFRSGGQLVLLPAYVNEYDREFLKR
jgi:hypothetical protein